MKIYPSFIARSLQKEGKSAEDMPLEITPIGAGFEANQTRPDLTDAQKATVIEEFAQKMTELQCAFQYKNSHMSELEESFIIKPLFILNRVL